MKRKKKTFMKVSVYVTLTGLHGAETCLSSHNIARNTTHTHPLKQAVQEK